MKISHRRIHFFAVIVAGAAFFIFRVQSPTLLFATTAFASSQVDGPDLITVAPPSLHEFSLRLPWSGVVISPNQVSLTAPVSGRIEAIKVADQARVKKGSIVMRLGGPQIAAQRSRLLLEEKSLEKRLLLAKEAVERLQQNLQTHLATKDQLAAAQDRRVMMGAQLNEARSKREAFDRQVTILAPLDGTFTNRKVVTGQEISAGQTVSDIVDTTHLRIVASLFAPPGLDLLGKEVAVHQDDGRALTAVLTSVLPHANQAGAIQVWMEGAQIDETLRPGQRVTGVVVIKTGPASLAVPRSAIVYDEQEQPLLYIRKNGTYEPRSIRTGRVEDSMVQVLSGITRDQSVVVRGAYELYYYGFNKQFKVQD